MKLEIKTLEKKIKKLEQKIKRMEEITVTKSITKNAWVWICTLLAIYFISDDNYGRGLITFFTLFVFSYAVHLDSHKKHHLFTLPHEYHHSHDNFFSHFIQYVIELGMPSLFLIIYLLFGTILFDKWVVLFVSVLYSTVHNINYSYFKVNNVHKLHHEHVMTNIGPDLCDIIFGTKHPDNHEVEDTNHYIPNIILITICILGLKRMCLQEPFNTLFFKYANYVLMCCFFVYIFTCIGLYFL